MIKLVADIAKRNNLGTLVKGENLTWHKMHAETDCPGEYLLSKMDYIIEEANKINNVEASYENENKQLDGISGENDGENFRRDIKNSNLKLTDFNEKMESHEASMIVSKVAYLMFTNENLNMDINKLSQLWFNAIYKLPNHIVDFEDVERAILLQAVELGYSESEVRQMADIFVSLGYPDYFDECTGKKIINTRKIQNLEMKEAVQLLQNNFGDWRGIKVNFEYVTTVVDDNRNVYYVINAFAEENFMYSGWEWLAEITDGKYYAGTYYVRNYYISDIVFAGQNPRDYGKYEYGDTIDGIFINRHYININSKNSGISSDASKVEIDNKTQQSVLEKESFDKENPNVFKIGDYTVKCGTYKGEDAATGETLIVNSDGTAVLSANFGNGIEEVKYTYKIEKHDFAQDISSSPSYEDAIVFYNADGSKAFGLCSFENNTLSDGGIGFYRFVE